MFVVRRCRRKYEVPRSHAHPPPSPLFITTLSTLFSSITIIETLCSPFLLLRSHSPLALRATSFLAIPTQTSLVLRPFISLVLRTHEVLYVITSQYGVVIFTFVSSQNTHVTIHNKPPLVPRGPMTSPPHDVTTNDVTI